MSRKGGRLRLGTGRRRPLVITGDCTVTGSKRVDETFEHVVEALFDTRHLVSMTSVHICVDQLVLPQTTSIKVCDPTYLGRCTNRKNLNDPH